MMRASSTSDAVGEVVVTREDDHVELCVSCPKLKTSRVYAFSLNEPLKGFCEQLSSDLEGDGDVELMTASGATMSNGVSHAFAWKPGR